MEGEDGAGEGACYDNLKCWDRVGGWEKKVQEGGDVCLFMADSHCCAAETDTML